MIGTLFGLAVRWILSALALVLIAKIIPGISASFGATLLAAVVIGLLNALVRPVIRFFTFLLRVLTLGLFSLVINAFLFWIASLIVPGFTIHGWRAALVGSVLYGIAGFIIQLAMRMFERRQEKRQRARYASAPSA